MNIFGLEIDIKNVPVLDEGFIPLSKFLEAYLKKATKPFAIAIERNGGFITLFETSIIGTTEMFEADCFFVERLVKILLWARGGYRIYICGDASIADHIADAYRKGGRRQFDFDLMSRIYEKEFEVVSVEYSEKPEQYEKSKPLGGHMKGCRIGFDAGGSDRKVSAVIDGETVYSEEVIWFPKLNEDPDYHFNGIVESFRTAASKMPRVDAIGISSAGIYMDNKTMAASLFIKVPENLFKEKIKNIYIRAGREIGENIHLEVANDGDVTALAGSIELNDTRVLGIAMGTSEAGGYVDKDGNITGWLNELAFVPVDANPKAPIDEWSGDCGCGVKYFSQDSVIRLAPLAGITLSDNLSPAEKLGEVQKLMAADHPSAKKIYETIGTYLGHSINLYSSFYEIRHVLLLGRVMTGEGGDIIIKTAKNVLESEYPQICSKISLHLPDENSRRIGQSVAAASLPEI
ncbi:MAG: ROK family protein [Saccharofermentanales bacterium]